MTEPSSEQYVFGYASLVKDGGPGQLTRLRGVRRAWGVATDNLRGIPGYKMYLRRSDGSRPGVFVAFLDLVPHAGTSVNGVCRPVTDAELDAAPLGVGGLDDPCARGAQLVVCPPHLRKRVL